MKIKLLVVLALVATTTLFAQTKEKRDAKEFFWGSNDPYKGITEIPEKWKNESAVIIYKNENYQFHNAGAKVNYTTSIRKRIKLMDKAAVEEFSTFSFAKRFGSTKGGNTWKKKGGIFIGVKLVKPDGTEIEIDVEKDAVEVDDETKLAIANLEVGDIIDFYAYRLEPFNAGLVRFDAVETPLAEEYPIIDYKLFIEAETNFFVSFKTYNGAPGLIKIPTQERSLRQYKLIDSDIEKQEDVRWFYPLIALPSYKFQVHFSSTGVFAPSYSAFLPSRLDGLLTEVSREDLLNSYSQNFVPTALVNDYGMVPESIKPITKFLKGKKYNSQEEKVTAVYYFMRHYYLTRFVEAFYVEDAELYANPFSLYGRSSFFRNQEEFIRYFTKFLIGEKIPFEIVLGTNRTNGSISKLLLEENLSAMVKVLTPTPLYASFFGVHTSINEYSALLEGTKVYLLSATKKKFDVAEDGTLPTSTYADNEANMLISLHLNEDFTDFNLKSASSFKGFLKESQLNSRLIYTDFVNEDYQKYGTTSFAESGIPLNKKDQLKKELAALNEKLKEQQEERFKERTIEEYGIKEVENYTYSIDETGRYGLSSNFTFTENFTAKTDAFLKKAGPNYIVEIGKLIGVQVQLAEKERNRKENIYMDFPRAYNYQVRFKIPKGYSVSGLEKLNKSVDNAAGAFISTAIVEGDELVVTTTKQYKTNYEPNSNWPLILAFLDESNQFTNEKVLLKKD